MVVVRVLVQLVHALELVVVQLLQLLLLVAHATLYLLVRFRVIETSILLACVTAAAQATGCPVY